MGQPCSDHPYIHALKKILFSITTYGRKYRSSAPKRIQNILSVSSGYAAVISGGDGYIAVVKRNKPRDDYLWSVYQFDGDNLLLSHTCQDYRQFFLNSRTGNMVINGYMPIGSKTMPEL
ncbi:MAG: hypothetical protein OXC48_08250 [Endozoicomonadaceae bacterium]|nr:hypothetical protein [Endozoicomonadaceae bacterium]